jgi:hypothetical protein
MTSHMNEATRVNKYMPLAIVYFFFNGFLLPLGLLYTTILSPLLLIWLSKYSSFRYLKFFFLFTLPFAIIHFINGVDTEYYLRSYLLLFSVYVFALCFYQFLKICRTLKMIYRNLVLINFIFTLFALAALFTPWLREKLWSANDISNGIEGVYRLKLLTYEPSYYSTLLVPLALYYYLKSLMNKLTSPRTMLVMITVPLVLSFSFGVMSAMFLSLLLLLLLNAGAFFSKRKRAVYIFIFLLLLLIGLLALLFFFPDNIFMQRLVNVLEGRDSSFKGRTYDAFYLGRKVAEMKSIFFGSGLGQTKVLGLELWKKYYANNFTINKVAIPNAMGETLAIFGLAGISIRLTVEVFFFFQTKVSGNYYRLLLFIFVFIYQFTGSFIFNVAEYVIWMLAFTNVFEEFNNKSER